MKVRGESEKVDVQIHWVGGHRTGTTLVRPVARLEQLSYYSQLMKRVADLHGDGLSPNDIADKLNGEGWRPPKRRDTFNRPMVHQLLRRQGISQRRHGNSRALAGERRPDEWTLPELARELSMPHVTLYSWLTKGRLIARRAKARGGTLWLVHANKAELRRLRSLRKARRKWALHVHMGVGDDAT